MKKVFALTFGALIISGGAFAGEGDQAVSVGFIQMKSDGLRDIYKDTEKTTSLYGKASSDGYDDPKGMFIRYRYEFDNLWGVIGSFSYAVNDGKVTTNTDSLRATVKTTAEYASAIGGPSLRINDYISVYTLAGVAYKHIKQNVNAYTPYGSGTSSVSEDKFNFAYSIGAQFNIYEGLVFDAAYEASPGNSDWKTDGFTIGLGYKF
ncbi:Ail/Lom family outer membrane beta-barrel protein [Citrobacter farmeri]